MTMMVNLNDLPGGDFEGYRYGDVASTFIWVQMKPGRGPKLHRHPYAEIFIILEGRRGTRSATKRSTHAAGRS